MTACLVLWRASVIAGRLLGAWLVCFAGAGQGLMYRFPERLGDTIETFLRVTDPGSK